MRKSTWIMVGILAAAMVAMMFAANAMVQPLARDAELSGLLTRYFEGRRDLRPGTKVTAIRKGATAKRLAKDGAGVVVECFPSDEVLRKDGGLDALARALARMTFEEVGAAKTRWVEVKFRLSEKDDPPGAEPLRTLVSLDDDAAFGVPNPPLPRRLPVPAAPPPASPGGPPAGR